MGGSLVAPIGTVFDALALLRLGTGPAAWLAVGGILVALRDLWLHFVAGGEP